MDSTLNKQHVLPGQIPTLMFIPITPHGQPYTVVPWTSEPLNGSLNSGLQYGDNMGDIPYPIDVIDWILVTVREDVMAPIDGLNPNDAIWSCVGWLHRSGQVTFPENCPFPAIDINADYYIVVEHRNHLGILSPHEVDVVECGNALSWDFTIADSYKTVFRVGQKQLEPGMPGVWGMYSSNGEQSTGMRVINSADRTIWAQQQGQFGYRSADFNMDFHVDGIDETQWKINQGRSTAVIFY